MTTPPAGWYPDPGDPTEQAERYWDGSAWTQQTRPRPAPAAAPPAPMAPTAPPIAPPGPPAAGPAPQSVVGSTEPAKTGGRGVGLLVVAAIALVVAVGGVAAILLLRSDDDTTDTDTTATTVGDTDDDLSGGGTTGDGGSSDDDSGSGDDDDFDFDFGDDGPGLADVTEPVVGDQCRVLGLDFADDIQVLLAVTNPHGDGAQLIVEYHLTTPDGARFGSGSEWINSPRAGERIIVESDSFEDLPSSVGDPTEVGCSIASMELSDYFGDVAPPSGTDSCSVVGLDFADDIQVELSFTSPFESVGDMSVDWVLRDSDGVRFASNSTFVDGASPGERLLLDGDSLSGLPGWTDMDRVSCEIVNYTLYG